MNGAREKILGRIREALQNEAPQHHSSPPAQSATGHAATTADFRNWLPIVGTGADEQRALFKRQCELLRAEVEECATIEETASRLLERARRKKWQRVAYHRGTLLEQVVARFPSSIETLRIDDRYDKEALERCDAGLTECESLVAQTGSICVSAASSGGRALSVLPPEHIVVARRAQLLPDLSAAYEQLAEKYRGNYPSFISFISGPSRTGDIERILVLGAHGPRELTIFLVAE